MPAVAQIAGDVYGSKVRARPGLRESVSPSLAASVASCVMSEAPRLEECGRVVLHRKSCDTETRGDPAAISVGR